MKRKRILLVSDTHYCQVDFNGVPTADKMKRLIQHINDEYAKDPFEFILFLGDYSLDHWQWNTKGTWLTKGKSYTKDFVVNYCCDLPTPYYMIPGNHEQFGEEMWKQVSGCSRNFHVVLDDFLFILWDSFGGNLDPDFHSDGTYTPMNVKQIRKIMDMHPDKKVFLCSHHIEPSNTEEEIALFNDERVICAFRGHTHSSTAVAMPEAYAGKLIVQTGGWNSITPESHTPWGIRDMYLDDHSAVTRYIVQENELIHKGEKFTVPYGIQDEYEFKF